MTATPAPFKETFFPSAEMRDEIRPDGSIRWIYDRGFQVHDVSGKTVRHAGIVERILASPRFLPASVNVKGLPCCAPRGCNSAITGCAERLNAEASNAETVQSNIRHFMAHLRRGPHRADFARGG